MDNFDQLLKEKIEQKQYAYKASAWRKFARQSGIGTSVGALKIAAISLVTVGLLSTGGYLAYKYLSSKPVDETTQVMAEPSEEPTIVAEDTLQLTEIAAEEPMQPSPKQEAKTNATATRKVPAQQSATQTEEPKKPIERNDNWRVVIINPDTIGPEN